ncbi:hypothetical protein BDZ97DRAFT_2061937 [Flammula alnicola]|nr:hypothetical protein BDZ97DRAFT_2061937 [Flammula alnicola]
MNDNIFWQAQKHRVTSDAISALSPPSSAHPVSPAFTNNSNASNANSNNNNNGNNNTNNAGINNNSDSRADTQAAARGTSAGNANANANANANSTPPLVTSAAQTKPKPNRRAYTAEARATHNAVERQRREVLHERFLDLAALLPNLSHIQRPSKFSIINSSIAHMHAFKRYRLLASRELQLLQNEADALRCEINEWRNRARIPRLEEPARGEGFGMLLSGELEEVLAVLGEEGEEGEFEDGQEIVGAYGEQEYTDVEEKVGRGVQLGYVHPQQHAQQQMPQDPHTQQMGPMGSFEYGSGYMQGYQGNGLAGFPQAHAQAQGQGAYAANGNKNWGAQHAGHEGHPDHPHLHNQHEHAYAHQQNRHHLFTPQATASGFPFNANGNGNRPSTSGSGDSGSGSPSSLSPVSGNGHLHSGGVNTSGASSQYGSPVSHSNGAASPASSVASVNANGPGMRQRGWSVVSGGGSPSYEPHHSMSSGAHFGGHGPGHMGGMENVNGMPMMGMSGGMGMPGMHGMGGV